MTQQVSASALLFNEIPMSEFKARRECFFKKMPPNSVAFFSAAKEVTRSNDTEYAFCQNKNFYYLTGFNEPEALLVLCKVGQNQQKNQSVLFSLAKDAHHEIWHGRRVGQLKAQQHYGVDQCFVLDEINTLVPQYLNGINQVFFSFDNSVLNSQVFEWLAQVKATTRQGGKAPSTLLDATLIIDELRLIKSDAEIEIMRQANYISGLAHQRAMQKTQADKFEYQIEAEILHEFACHGAKHPAYASIVAGGDNANILHYTDNNALLTAGELLLIDAGGELAGYAADITRTFPINGKFTVEQKTLYQLVLDVQNMAINAIKPHCTFAKLTEIIHEFLTKGLFELGILSGDLPQLIKNKASKKYLIHGIGHWLGLDVHDVGDYQSNTNKEQLRAFETGMVLTIEPGIYIPLDDESVDKKWRGIGIRIEDNIVVTKQGFENLTVNAPKTINDIEMLMAQ
ncbi:MAG: Xaa-Pro aminopeptidase [Colwellia sp.]